MLVVPPSVRSWLAGAMGRLRGFGGTSASNPAPPVATTVSVTPSSVAFALGDTQQFSASVLDQYGQPFSLGQGAGVSFSSSDTNLVTMSSSTATGIGYGSVTITATVDAPNVHLTGQATATIQQPTKLAIVQQPAGAVTGSAFGTQPIVQLQDTLSATDGEAGRTVTVTIGSGAGTLGGTTSVITNGAGQAVFTNLVITATSPPSGFTLTFASTGLTGASSASFTVEANTRTYSTTFPLTENPISEGGQWRNGGVVTGTYTNVRTTTNLARGTQTGANGLDDSIAVLVGTWAPNHEVEAVCVVGGSGTREIELHLRGSIIGADNITTYEVDFPIGAAVQVARWDGSVQTGQFTNIGNPISVGTLVTGDRIRARVVDAGATVVITIWKNDVQMGQATDSSAQRLLTGAPGIGFFIRNDGGQLATFGVSAWTGREV